jgi:Tfp pilus assembly protein PilF
VASSPDDPNPAVLLAGLLGESGQPERGLAVLAPWLEHATPSTDVLTTRGTLLARLNRHAEALASFRRAREQDPSSAMILVQMATVHLAAGDRGRARAALEEALRRDGDLALAHDQLGVLALAEGDADEAESRFRAALDRDPDQADALLNLGRLLLARKRAEEARPALERFVAVAPRDVYGREVAAVRTWLDGRSGQARRPAPAAF